MTSPVLSPSWIAEFKTIRLGFTTRQLGDGLAPLPNFLAINSAQLVAVKQIHSNRVVTYDPAECYDWEHQQLPEGDAIVCNTVGPVLAIRTADCVPLLCYAPDVQAIAAVHAGWRGIESGIIENTLNTLAAAYGASLSQLRVAIGPCICATCFEIGPEVAEKFAARFGRDAPLSKGNGDRSHLDLVAACKLILSQAAIPNPHIESLDLCTACRPDLFYSYRRDGAETGRLVSFVGVTTSN